MGTEKTRREAIRLLGLAGFSLYLPSCWDSTEVTASKDKLSTSATDTSIEGIIDTTEKTFVPDERFVSFYRYGDTEYDRLKVGFNLRVPKKPAIIALCENTEGVAQAVKYARAKDLKISVKSGGHSFESFSSNNGGMQINLSLINHVEFLGNDQVKIGPACLLRELYDAILPKNRILPAGSCGTVGVAGLTLGGGYGFFARKYGLSCDSLLQATLVDAKGEIHKISDEHELMWALKGGGNGNFGVVTDLTFKTYPAPKGFTRHRFKAFQLDAPRAKQLLENWFAYSKDLPKSAFSAFVLNGKTLTLLITHFKKKEEGIQKMIDLFTELTDKASIGTSRNLAKSLKTYYGIEHPIYFKNASAGYYQDFNHIEPFIEPILKDVVTSRGLIYQVNTLGGNINDSDFKSKSSYPHRDLPYLSELQAYWEENSNPKQLLAAYKKVQQAFYTHGIRTQYRNYPDLDFKGYETAYYGEKNYPKLQELKRKYDPEMVFDYPQGIKV